MGKKSRNRKRNRRKGFKNRPFYERLIIPTHLYERIRALTLEAKGEISAFGRTNLVKKDGEFTGTSVELQELEVFTQECESYHTTLKKDALHTLYYEVAKKGGNPEEWNFWWHSHVDMDTGFSGEDDRTMTAITKKDVNGVGGTIIALCTNKDGDTTATIYKDGKRLMEELPLVVMCQVSEKVREEAKETIKNKVTYVSEFNYRHLLHDYEYDYLDPEDIDECDVKAYTQGMTARKAKRFLHGVREFFRDTVGL